MLPLALPSSMGTNELANEPVPALQPELPAPHELRSVAKSIADLDDLMALLLKSFQKGKQRTLLPHVQAAYDQLQLMRLVIVMDQADSEMVQAALGIRGCMRLVNALSVRRRIEPGLRAGICLSTSLADSLVNRLEAMVARASVPSTSGPLAGASFRSETV